MTEKKESKSGGESCSCGCGSISIGAFIAVLMSWTTNHSIIYAFLHGLLGWLYVIFWLFVHWGEHGGKIPW